MSTMSTNKNTNLIADCKRFLKAGTPFVVVSDEKTPCILCFKVTYDEKSKSRAKTHKYYTIHSLKIASRIELGAFVLNLISNRNHHIEQRAFIAECLLSRVLRGWVWERVEIS